MKPNARKNIIYSLVLFALVLLVYAWRTREGKTTFVFEGNSQPGKMVLSGKVMATSYQVTYLDQKNRNFQSSVDSLLKVFSLSVSNEEPTSEVNRFNLRDTLLAPSHMLVQVLHEANRIYDLTGGALDPTQTPLENRWDFSPSGPRLMDSTELRVIFPWVGLKKIVLTDTLIRKSSSGTSLNFSKSAKGYAVDLIGAFLQDKGIRNFLIQIGGENLAKGSNEKGELWKIGLFYAADTVGTKATGVIALQDKAISTGGNFEQFYTQDSLKLSFTVDPRIGVPVSHGLLGVTVVAPEAKTANAMAEALMVLGWREAIHLDTTISDLGMLLIYNEKGGKIKQYVSPELTGVLSFPVK